jgi:hypothetical protein
VMPGDPNVRSTAAASDALRRSTARSRAGSGARTDRSGAAKAAPESFRLG